MRSVIVAASFDPIHYGHLNVIDRVLKVFDHVLIGIGINPKKKYTFELEERETTVRNVLKLYGDRVTVKSYSGLLIDFAYENQINTIIRGARNSADFDFEQILSDINQNFKMDIDTYILVADQSLSHISSSAIKELQLNQAKNIIDYVPLIVKQALEARISHQLLVGITGGIGSGKSYVTKKLWEMAKINSGTERACGSGFSHPNFHYIDMDELGRYILKESVEPIHQSIRREIANKLCEKLLVDDMIDMDKMLAILFDDAEAISARSIFEQIMMEPMMHLIRRKLLKLEGII